MVKLSNKQLVRDDLFYWLLKYTVGPIVKLIWVKKVNGLKNIPRKGPVILAANHSSYFDFIAMIAICPRRITFVAAEVFYRSWFWRPIMLLTGQVKIDRNAKNKSFVYVAAKAILDRGDVFGIFPEGTRSRSGKLQKAFAGVARIAQQNATMIVPVAIVGAYEVMAPIDKWPRLRKVIEISFLEKMEVAVTVDPRQFVDEELMPVIAAKVGQEYDF